MKIAIVGPIDSPINLNATGGTEVWTYNYTESLVKLGHQVTLFAAKGSQTTAELVETCDINDFTSPEGKFSTKMFGLCSARNMVELIKRQAEFDLVHLSVASPHHSLALSELIKVPLVVTIHVSSLTPEEMKLIFNYYPQPHYVFISQSEAKKWPEPKNHSVILNGINLNDFSYNEQPEDYCFWIGRFNPTKGADIAIKAAILADKKLCLAGGVQDRDYYENYIEPNLNSQIKSVGSLSHQQKNDYYMNARVLLMPIQWEEPFGLVVVEAMACGTPVIAFERGAMAEIIKNGVNGYLVKPGDIKDFSQKVKEIFSLPNDQYLEMRRSARKAVEEHFALNEMVKKYTELYDTITK